MLALPLFVAGAAFGSFATAIAHRVPRRENWVSDRSRCPSCGTTVAAYDNVPILSWLLLRGRCRSCGERISARYPLAELGLGALWVGTYLAVGTDDVAQLGLGFALCFVLVIVTLTDLELRVIPNRVVATGAVVALAVIAATDPSLLADRALAAAAAGGGLFLVALAYPRGMGMGDVKLVAMMGLYLGRAVAPALLIGFAVGALVGAAMIARRGSAARKEAIPFGPFLALGGVVGLWFGDQIVDWYLDEFVSGS
jgi:leader peptidase (prepilin peptidase)/N-methyltransferase